MAKVRHGKGIGGLRECVSEGWSQGVVGDAL